MEKPDPIETVIALDTFVPVLLYRIAQHMPALAADLQGDLNNLVNEMPDLLPQPTAAGVQALLREWQSRLDTEPSS